jgi:hypothetical protein
VYRWKDIQVLGRVKPAREPKPHEKKLEEEILRLKQSLPHFPPKGCCSSDTASEPRDAEGRSETQNRGRPEETVGRVQASQGNRLGETCATSSTRRPSGQ